MRNADERRPASAFLRVSLWLVGRASALVPFDRRDEWRKAWTGELWHRARKPP